MTNREKYAKEILDIACSGSLVAVKNGVPCRCSAIECSECDLHNGVGCDNNLIKWCEAEYIEPAIDWSKVPIDTPCTVQTGHGAGQSFRLAGANGKHVSGG